MCGHSVLHGSLIWITDPLVWCSGWSVSCNVSLVESVYDHHHHQHRHRPGVTRKTGHRSAPGIGFVCCLSCYDVEKWKSKRCRKNGHLPSLQGTIRPVCVCVCADGCKFDPVSNVSPYTRARLVEWQKVVTTMSQQLEPGSKGGKDRTAGNESEFV